MERTFGVEVEHGHPLNSDGVREMLDAAEDALGKWSVGQDGSGVEARTPVLRGEEGFGVLRAAMDLIRDSGGYTTRSDGMHVHLGAEDYIEADSGAVIRLMESWVNNERHIEKLVHPWRRKSPMCAKYITKTTVDNAKKSGKVAGYGGALNLTTVTSCRESFLVSGRYSKAQPTFEIRLHEGTLDPDEACSWVKFLISLADKCFAGEVFTAYKDHVAFLEAMELEPDALAALLHKAETSDKKEFGNRPYDNKGKAKKGYWFCQASHSTVSSFGCDGVWHKDGESCPKGKLRNEYDQDSYNGRRVMAGGF